MRWTLTRSVLLATTLVAAVLVGAAALLTLSGQHDSEVAVDETQAASVAAVVAVTGDDDLLRRVLSRIPSGAQGRLAVDFGDGHTIGASKAAAADITDALRTGRPAMRHVNGFDIHLTPVTSTARPAVVEVSVPGTWPTEHIGGHVLPLLLLGLAAVALSTAMADKGSRRIVAVLRRLTGSVHELDTRSVLPPIPVSAPNELAELGRAIHGVAERLAGLLASERELLADLSHRLRTPLTALRLDAEAVGLGPVADRVRHSVQALEREVDDIIRTARDHREVVTTACDAVEVVSGRMSFWSLLARDQLRPFHFTATPSTAPVRLDRKALGAAIDSLLVNVFSHTPAPTALAVAVVRHAGWVTVVVDDGGAGIADPEAALRRGVSNGNSTGLGLDIARHAAESGGGTIHIERASLGGARIRLRLPDADREPARQEPLAVRLWQGRLPASDRKPQANDVNVHSGQ